MRKVSLYVLATVALVAVVLFFRPSKSVQKELILADSLMEIRPDSALNILEKLKHSYLTGENKIRYALLMTRAQFKNRKSINSDSLIKIAYEYYIPRKDSLCKAQAYLYKGRVDENMGNKGEALKNYQRASVAALPTKKYDLLALIYNRWGLLLRKQYLYTDALIIQNRSLKYSVLCKDTIEQIFILKEIGSIYSVCQNYPQALIFYKKALYLAELIKNSDRISDICNSLGLLNKNMGKYDVGMFYVNKSLSLLSDSTLFSPRYSLKGNLFSLKQQYDSARYYLSLSRVKGNMSSEATYCSLISDLEEKQGNYKEALSFSNKYISFIFKIIDTEREHAIVELQKKYDYSLIKNENTQLELENKNRNIFILMVLIGFIVSVWIASHRYAKIKQEKDEIIRAGKEQLDQMADKLVERQMEIEQIQLKSKADIDAFMKWVLSENEVMKKIEELNKMGTGARIANKERMKLTSKEILNLKKVVNVCFDNFAIKLNERFPNMTEENFQYCCLLKMKVPADIIAILLGVTDSSLVKRKYRLKKEIIGMTNGCSTLEEFFSIF